MQLKVVLPTYNEAENLPRMVAALLALPLPDVQLSILVVDDNSPDGTGALADTLAAGSAGRVAVLHRLGKEGLGLGAQALGFFEFLRDGCRARV